MRPLCQQQIILAQPVLLRHLGKFAPEIPEKPVNHPVAQFMPTLVPMPHLFDAKPPSKRPKSIGTLRSRHDKRGQQAASISQIILVTVENALPLFLRKADLFENTRGKEQLQTEAESRYGHCI